MPQGYFFLQVVAVSHRGDPAEDHDQEDRYDDGDADRQLPACRVGRVTIPGRTLTQPPRAAESASELLTFTTSAVRASGE